MSRSIYDISTWAAGTSYVKHDVISYNNEYYYAITDHTSDADFYVDLNNGKWGGYITDTNGSKRPYFLWLPSYNSAIKLNPRVKSVKYGDGYEQRAADGINNLLLECDYTFDNLDIHQATAILHFLNERSGTESFLFTSPRPFNTIKRFICRSWDVNYTNYNLYVIRATFEETTV